MKFENGEDQNLTAKEKYEAVKKGHPDARTFSDKIKHKIQEVGPMQDWLEKRADMMVDESGMNEVVGGYEKGKKIRIADIGGGSQHIENEIINDNPDKDISAVGIDLSDHASKKIMQSKAGEKINSVFGEGKELPIMDKSVDIASAYFTFQELSDDQQKKVLDDMIRIIEDDGKIIIVDEPPQEEDQKESLMARAKNIFRNAKVSEYNLHEAQDWRNLFDEKGLKIIDKKEFREDGKEVSEENPAQFFSYILEKVKKEAQ